MASVLKDANGRSDPGRALDGAPDKNSKVLAVGSPSREVENTEPKRPQDAQGPPSSTERAIQRQGGSSKLSKEEVQDIFKNCIKLAAESKINAKNSFNLNLIDHMEDLVKDGAEEGKTNFQQASCTLDAGVQIYSYRVDAVHTDLFKTLNGLHRTALHGDNGAEEEADGCEAEGAAGRRKQRKSSNPESTLEPFESLNAKKLDLGFAVDPLFQRTSAQFDAGGAHGLLMHNLSVLRGCEIVFDSQDRPEELLKAQAPSQDVQIDTRSLPAVLSKPPHGASISPAVEELRRRLAQSSGAGPSRPLRASPAEIVAAALGSSGTRRLLPSQLPTASALEPPMLEIVDEHGEDSWEPESVFFTADDGGEGGGAGESSVYYGMSDEIGGEVVSTGPGQPSLDLSLAQGGNDDQGPEEDGGVARDDERTALQRLLDASIGNGGLLSGAAWAGSSHWRYRAAGAATKLAADASADSGGSPQSSSASGAVRGRGSKAMAPLDFLKLPPIPSGAFELAAKPSSLCLAASTLESQAGTLLPEDHKYQVQDLAKLFLRPRSLWSRRRPSQSHGPSMMLEDGGDYGGDGGFDGDDGGFEGDNEGDFDGFQDAMEAWGTASDPAADGMQLAEAPRKVQRMEIGYSRAAKQVDVRALKELLWESLEEQNSRPKEDGEEQEDEEEGSAPGGVAFEEVLRAVPESSAAGALEDLSVHLCFICALHLANEHGLSISSGEGLDTLSISLPTPSSAS